MVCNYYANNNTLNPPKRVIKAAQRSQRVMQTGPRAQPLASFMLLLLSRKVAEGVGLRLPSSIHSVRGGRGGGGWGSAARR